MPNNAGGTLYRLQALRDLLHGIVDQEDSDDSLNDSEDEDIDSDD